MPVRGHVSVHAHSSRSPRRRLLKCHPDDKGSECPVGIHLFLSDIKPDSKRLRQKCESVGKNDFRHKNNPRLRWHDPDSSYFLLGGSGFPDVERLFAATILLVPSQVEKSSCPVGPAGTLLLLDCPVVCCGQVTCRGSLPSSSFTDIILVAQNQPPWEDLHHGN